MKLNKIKILNKCINEFKERDRKAKLNSQKSSDDLGSKAAGVAGKKPIGKNLKSDSSAAVGDDLMRKKQNLIKPEDQLNLTDSELREEITRTLGTGNINSPKNIVEYNYSLGEFIPKPLVSTTIVLIRLEGCCLPRDSPEAKAQIASGCWSGDDLKNPPKAKSNSAEVEKDVTEEEAEEETGGDAGEECKKEEEEKEEDKGEEEEPEAEVAVGNEGKPQKKLTNAFNYCERAALTMTSTKVNSSTQTIPPPRKNFSELVTQWIIYDAYAEDFEKQQKEKEKEKEKKVSGTQTLKKEDSKKRQDCHALEALQMKTNEAAKILDRMICQNIYDEIAHDYKYYEDPSDEYRKEGTLLPLWKFSYDKTKRNAVTDISWNPQYYDLFSVTFGTFDFLKQQSQEGAVCLFTLKNPSYPEYIRHTDSSAMCIATHPLQTHLVVIGMLDGNVAVYNTRLPDKCPQYQSNSVNKKHWGIVWQVEWGKDMQDGEVNFFSVSADGKVCNWILMQNELAVTTVASLSMPFLRVLGPDGGLISIKDCGCSITFHPRQPLIFLVGTEEGSIYKCSTSYSSTFLFKYDAHHMPVHKISYNLFNPDIFLSCSSDWRIKIWEDQRSEPLFVFDLGCAVGDVQWAPYSSTVFAAVTADGKCHVFDIHINKYKPICVQNVASKKKNGLTRLRFNYKMPILAVGDDKDSISVLKLSPNLRIKPKPPKKQQFYEPEELEKMKLEKLLALVREPATTKTNEENSENKSE
ncbi:hypothetical protein RUM43_004670 [Polyplax serrata]|uniref:Dynein intermediate chain 2, ciliary n=1 Tax=Polyplax serrata TaxID=468196 RepID=A0AAN8XQA9_POLSC